ncbi:uncharacterized protein BXIN_1164 [Babesia sp. Xinjiang]|uniref:uncharacterized protein n=1 Tax=Babesia sp. Xinjiang TaxID=462227 RepID=UPI000A22242D|nr:uncharacterized protein BXIN_1164 [Babesia sp. Xinjiang]ORM40171.1 hypothetical protein BXIN_1164 [Babesia sp. Xinjiang]
MRRHLPYTFKALVACISAFPFSYLVALVITQLNNYEGIAISRRIRSSLCSSSVTQHWVSNVWTCGDVRGEAGLENFGGVSFFSDSWTNGATLVKTSKTATGVEVETNPGLLRSSHELIRRCREWTQPPKEAVQPPLLNNVLLGELCSMIENRISSHAVGETAFSEKADMWEMVYTLLSNVNNLAELARSGFLPRTGASKYQGGIANGRGTDVEHLNKLLRPIVDYIDMHIWEIPMAERLTTDTLMQMDMPLSHVVELALPFYFDPEYGAAQDTVFRLFTAFPEAAAMLVYAVQHKLVAYPKLNVETKDKHFSLLAIFIANLQIMVASKFDKLSAFATIAAAKEMNWLVTPSLDQFWDSFATDMQSRVYLMNLFKRAAQTKVSPAFHHTIAYNVEIAARAAAYVFANYGLNAAAPLARLKLSENVAFHMTQLCRFTSIDTDHTGKLSLQEFVGSTMSEGDTKQFNRHLEEMLEKQSNLYLHYDVDLVNWPARMVKQQHRKAMEALNVNYNEVMDKFMLVDADGSGDVSLEEFFQHAYATAPLTTLNMSK